VNVIAMLQEITLKDGSVIRYSDHYKDLFLDGITYAARRRMEVLGSDNKEYTEGDFHEGLGNQ
jgi:hypothetical protein